MGKFYGHGSLFNRLISYFVLFFLLLQTNEALSTPAIGYGGEEISIVSELPRRHPFLLGDRSPLQLAVIYKAVTVSGLKVKTSDHRWVYVKKMKMFQVNIIRYHLNTTVM